MDIVSTFNNFHQIWFSQEVAFSSSKGKMRFGNTYIALEANMDGNKVLQVIVLYRKRLQEMGVDKIDYPHLKLLPARDLRRLALAHCHGMLDKMDEFVAENRMEKVFRWLGFVQGVLWVLQVYALEELKNHNRPAE